MDRKSPKKYCFRDPKFPAKAFVAFLIGGRFGAISIIYPLKYIYTDFSEITKDADIAYNSINDPTFLFENCLLVPISYGNPFPLKKEFWKNPSLKFSDDTRMSLFIKAVHEYNFYNILVTPSKSLDNGSELYQAAIPFPLSATYSQIEQFMLQSDFPVDETARFAALYRIDEPFIFNWKSGAILQKLSSPLSKNIN